MFKDRNPSLLRSASVYKFKCAGWNAIIYGKNKRHFSVRMCEHLGILAVTGKRVKSDDDSAIVEHLLFWYHSPDFENDTVLLTNNNDFKVTLMENLLINRDHPPLKKNKQSLRLDCIGAVIYCSDQNSQKKIDYGYNQKQIWMLWKITRNNICFRFFLHLFCFSSR